MQGIDLILGTGSYAIVGIGNGTLFHGHGVWKQIYEQGLI